MKYDTIFFERNNADTERLFKNDKISKTMKYDTMSIKKENAEVLVNAFKR